MKGMKIKSYTFKKNSVLNKEVKPVAPQNINSPNQKENANVDTLKSNLIHDVDQILKSPGGFNISSKYDSKGNRFYY
jgi:hypothetical protein